MRYYLRRQKPVVNPPLPTFISLMKVNTLALVVTLMLGVLLGVGVARFVLSDNGGRADAAPPAASAPAPAAAPVVQVAPVRSMAISRQVSAVGSLRSQDSVILRPEITGRIAEINIDEGGQVSKGQVVIRLDDSVARAQLQQAEANLSLAASQNRRAAELTKQGFISKQARDEAISQLRVQQAAVALAKAQLEKTAILAPFDGMIGLRNVSVGDYVSPGTDLVPIDSINPLQVDFRIPEQYLGQVQPGLNLTLSFDALPGVVRQGQVGAISPQVDVGGRSILLRANVPNEDGTLRPGMFARVQLQFSDDTGLVVPEAAIFSSGDEQYVYKLDGERVQRIAVKIVQRREGQVEVSGPLSETDQVVVAGLQKISDGVAVRVLSQAASAATSP